MSTVLNNVYILVLAVGLASATGDAFINQYAKSGWFGWFIIGCMGWVIAAAFFSQILKSQLFGPGVALFFLGNISIALIIGWFYFGDRISLTQWLGILFGAIAMLLMVKG